MDSCRKQQQQQANPGHLHRLTAVAAAAAAGTAIDGSVGHSFMQYHKHRDVHMVLDDFVLLVSSLCTAV
jgi:hypothetical protein